MARAAQDRTVYFNCRLKNTLLDYRKITKNYEGSLISRSFGKKITSTSLHNTVSRIFKESGIYRKGLTIHSLRHTYAERLRKKRS